MVMKNWHSYFMFLLTAGLAVGSIVSCGGPQDEVVDLPGNYELRKKPGETAFAIYQTLESAPPLPNGKKPDPIVISEAVYEGVFEPLNIMDIDGSEMMIILQSTGKKYLFNGRNEEMMFDGNPFVRYAKDNDGGVFFETEAGLYPWDKVEGLPAPVEQYYRAGDTFIYRKGGKWGIYEKLIKSGTNVFRPTVYRYLELLPARFDKIRFVHGAGAFHFIAKADGRWQLYDGWGRVRYMCKLYGQHNMNTWSPTAAGEENITGTYINHIVSIPVGCSGKYIPYLKTRCTYTGTDEAGIIELESNENRYEGFFSGYVGDQSTLHLSWDEPDISVEYHY